MARYTFDDEAESFWSQAADALIDQEKNYPGLFEFPDDLEDINQPEPEDKAQMLTDAGYGVQEDEEHEDNMRNFMAALGYEDEPETEAEESARYLTGASRPTPAFIPRMTTGNVSVSRRSGEAYRYLQQAHGLPAHVAAGIAGNIQQESGFNTGSRGDGGKARGLAQWHPDRYAGLSAYARSQGKDPDDFYTQLDYLIHEGKQRGDVQRVMEPVLPRKLPTGLVSTMNGPG